MKELSSWRPQYPAKSDDIHPEYSYLPQPAEAGLESSWKVLVKRRKLIILLFLMVFGIVVYINLSATPLYTATAMLQIEPQNPSVTGLAEIISSRSDGSTQYDYYQTQFALLRSRTLAARVITSLKLESDPAFRAQVTSDSVVGRVMSWIMLPIEPLIDYGVRLLSPTKKPNVTTSAKNYGAPEVSPRLVSRYLSLLKVTPMKNTRLVEVAFITQDPSFSQKLANAHAAGFIRMIIDNRAALTDEAREFLDKKNAELRAKLERSEQALNHFRQRNGVVSLDKGENVVVDRLVALNSQLTAARAQRIDAEALFLTVKNKKNQLMTQGSIPQLKTNLTNIEAERVKLSTLFKPDHPRMQELVVQINAAREALNTEIANVVRGIESGYVAARAREQALESEAKRQEEKALNLKEIGVEYAVLQEDVNVNRSLFESVLKRLNETNVSNDIALSNIQITQRADLPQNPSSPNTSRNLLLGVLGGVLLGIGTAFLLEFLDTKIDTPEHVEKIVSLNTLGVVPDLNGLDRFQLQWKQRDGSVLSRLKSLTLHQPTAHHTNANELLMTKHHPQSIFPEAYRSIRTSLLFSRPDKHPQVILLTSASPGEGKTGTSVNLAIALAQDGHRVLLIDADLRKGCCHERLEMTNHKGLSDVLTGQLALEEGIQQTAVSGLSLLSCGINPPSPADLLGSIKMKSVLASLRESYQFIIIDTPPAVALTDASVLSIMADGVVLVFHGRKTTTASARQLIQRLDAVNASILGVVLNSVNLQDPNYSYYGHYNSYYSADDRAHTDDVDTPTSRPNGFESARVINTEERHSSNLTTAFTVKQDRQDRSNAPDFVHLTGDKKPVKEQASEVRATSTVNETVINDNSEVELIPQESLNRLIATVTKSLGPIGPLVVRDQIRLLGESYEAFPKRRIAELIKLLQHEITQRTNPS
jgi:polysaccharide biosynthesis transport protein